MKQTVEQLVWFDFNYNLFAIINLNNSIFKKDNIIIIIII